MGLSFRSRGKATGIRGRVLLALELCEDIQAFLDYLSVECGLSPNTVSAYRLDLDKFDAFVRASGMRSLKRLSGEDIVNFLHRLNFTLIVV